MHQRQPDHGAGRGVQRDIDDCRESPSLDIIELLASKGAEVIYHDPYVPSLRLGEETFRSDALTEEVLSGCDAVIICTDHTGIDYGMVVKASSLVLGYPQRDGQERRHRRSCRPALIPPQNRLPEAPGWH